jgi:putative ABC transport system permease protein
MIALRNLYRNWVRNLLTLFGAAVGIAVFVVLISISLTVKASLKSVVSAYEGDVVVQSRRSATPASSRITIEHLEVLRTLEGVATVTPVALGSVKTPWNPYFIVFGIPETFSSRFSLIRGRAFRKGAAELLLGEKASRAIGVDLGETVNLAGREFALVGIYATGAPFIDGAAVGGLEEVQEILDQPEIVNLALLRVRHEIPVEQIIKAIHRTFPRLRATYGADLVDQLQFFRTIDTFAGAISLVALLASCLVVSNTLLMAVWARTREIGILMAVGWSKSLIVRSLLTESLLICILAGLLGNALAVLFLRFLVHSGVMGLGWVPVAVPPAVFWISMAICSFLGLISGLYPAIVASTLSPAQVLRQE